MHLSNKYVDKQRTGKYKYVFIYIGSTDFVQIYVHMLPAKLFTSRGKTNK